MWSNVPNELETVVVPENSPKRQTVKRFVKVANNTFNLCYVQPEILPVHIEWLQKLNTEGLDFVKIPIDEKINMLYMRDNISRLLKQTNIQWDYTEELINLYQKNETDENRRSLLNVVKVALDFCERRNIEFLTAPVEPNDD